MSVVTKHLSADTDVCCHPCASSSLLFFLCFSVMHVFFSLGCLLFASGKKHSEKGGLLRFYLYMCTIQVSRTVSLVTLVVSALSLRTWKHTIRFVTPVNGLS